MLIGYVSDERYVAIPEALLEFQRGEESVAVVRTTPRGAVYADLPPGDYTVTLARDGFGAKTVRMRVDPEQPYHFRLLRDRLYGYAWPKWVRSGERSEFRAHSAEPYRLSLWRYGYEKEFIRLLGWFDEHGPMATKQITPDGDYVGSGCQWNTVGFGSKHHTQFVAGPERSGLYYFHAEGESGATFAFPWIVAPAQPTAPIAVLASNMNWNAYNNFGGRSNYVSATGLPERPTVYGRQDLVRYQGGSFEEWKFPDDAYQPLTFDRPEPLNDLPLDGKITDNIEGRQQCHCAPAEWRLLGWMEREGIDYDFYAESQLHDETLDLDAYQILVISTHPEYWTRHMYDRVKEWVFNRGGRFMYLGGNGLNCEVEILEDGAMRCNTQLASLGGALAVKDKATGQVLESRLHRRYESEANLLGVVCTESGIMTAAPYQVKNSTHWVFAGTGLREGDLFGEASLHERCHGGASGHETDKMSPSSPANTALLAKGINPEEGGAEIVLHEPEGGGAVFSVGSISYPASILVDEQVSRITKNVIERFLG